MDSSEAAVSIYREEPDGVLALHGRLHLDLARDLHRTALDLALAGGSVVVDLSAAEFLDTWAIQILLTLKQALERGAGSLRIRGESAEVRNYLGWAGLDGHFPMRGEAAPSAGGRADSDAQAPQRKRRGSSRKLAV